MPMVQNVSSTMRMVSLEPLMDDSPAKAAMVAGVCLTARIPKSACKEQQS